MTKEERIKRVKKELAQSRLSLVAVVTGLHPHTLRAIIAGTKKPHDGTITQLEKYFDLDVKKV